MSHTETDIETQHNEPSEAGPGRGAIVVGLDGSAGSLPALRWAVQEAQLRGVPVHAVMAWEQPVPYFGASGGWALGEDPAIGSKTDLAAAAAVEVTRLQEEAGVHEQVPITYEPVEGHPAEVLVRASTGAVALVVGSRGHGGFAGALLGSVSQRVVQHATCPVVVIPNSYETSVPAVRRETVPLEEHDTVLTVNGVVAV